jgi:hypothetical protein
MRLLAKQLPLALYGFTWDTLNLRNLNAMHGSCRITVWMADNRESHNLIGLNTRL